MSRASLDWTDPIVVARWLDGLRQSFEEVDDIVFDMLRPPRQRELGPALHARDYNAAHDQILAALDFAGPEEKPRRVIVFTGVHSSFMHPGGWDGWDPARVRSIPVPWSTDPTRFAAALREAFNKDRPEGEPYTWFALLVGEPGDAFTAHGLGGFPGEHRHYRVVAVRFEPSPTEMVERLAAAVNALLPVRASVDPPKPTTSPAGKVRVYPTGAGWEAWRIERDGEHVADVLLTIHATKRGEYVVTLPDRPEVGLWAQLARSGTFSFDAWDRGAVRRVLDDIVRPGAPGAEVEIEAPFR